MIASATFVYMLYGPYFPSMFILSAERVCILDVAKYDLLLKIAQPLVFPRLFRLFSSNSSCQSYKNRVNLLNPFKLSIIYNYHFNYLLLDWCIFYHWHWLSVKKKKVRVEIEKILRLDSKTSTCICWQRRIILSFSML